MLILGKFADGGSRSPNSELTKFSNRSERLYLSLSLSVSRSFAIAQVVRMFSRNHLKPCCFNSFTVGVWALAA